MLGTIEDSPHLRCVFADGAFIVPIRSKLCLGSNCPVWAIERVRARNRLKRFACWIRANCYDFTGDAGDG